MSRFPIAARRTRPARASRTRKPVVLAVVVALVVLVGGCAAFRQARAMSTERLLVAAGFQMKVADTPARLAQVESLPQRKLTRVPYKGESRFVYADEQFCECLYAGTEKAYDRYQRSLRDQRVADEQREASDEQLEASINWGEWGGWGPWW